MKPFSTAFLAVLFFASAGHADVRYSTHVEVRRTTGADRADTTRIGAVVEGVALPGDSVTYIGADSVRIEQSQGATKSVVLIRPDGQFILDPDRRTYVRVAQLDDLLKGAEPLTASTFKRTGSFATILGIRAEHIEFTVSVPLPIAPLPGFPTVITMKGDVWLGNLPGSQGAGLRIATGLTKTLPTGLEGIALRQVMRSDEFGYEVETTVNELMEGPVPLEMFSVPSNYRDITGTPLR